MIRFLAGRIAFAMLVLLALSTFVFLLFFVAPGDPARLVAGDKATEAQLVQIRSNLGLDRPIHEQYVSFLGRAVQGDLGFSYRNQQPVLKLIANSLYVFYFLPRQAGFTLFPAGGFKPFWPNPAIWAWHMFLPWMTVALTTAAVYARLTRGQMLEVMGEDYIRTARAKGLPETTVVLKHGMRATLTPLVTQLGADIAFLLGGAIVIEQVYGLQGVGALAVQAVNTQDRPIIIGVVMLGGLFIVMANIIVDIAYALLDPRVRQR